jgi:hypothetical protein
MSFNANTLYRAVDIDKLAKECSDAIKGRSNQRPFFIVPTNSQSSKQGLTQC